MRFIVGSYGLVVECVLGGGSVVSGINLGGDDVVAQAAIDAIEAMVLAHACAGIDVGSKAYSEGVDTAIDAMLNNTCG